MSADALCLMIDGVQVELPDGCVFLCHENEWGKRCLVGMEFGMDTAKPSVTTIPIPVHLRPLSELEVFVGERLWGRFVSYRHIAVDLFRLLLTGGG